MIIECRHILTSGRKCHSPSLRGKPFCFHHAKFHFHKSTARKPRQRHVLAAIDSGLGLEAAMKNAITALRSPLIGARRAGLLIYGLNIAANLRTSFAAVQTPISRGNNGNLIGARKDAILKAIEALSPGRA